jgi:FRG domain-containing protein
MPVREIVVRSLGEFVDVVTPREPDPQTRRRRDTGVYRGGSEATRPLLTSLDRLGGVEPAHTKADLEEHILRNFIRYSRPHLDDARPHNDWELLISAQHHGVPTRLLDWSYSPLVGAFFATRPLARAQERDRAVWRLDWQSVHRHFKLPPLALLIQDLETLLGAESLTPWKLFTARGGRAFACMIEPPSLDNRIVAQAATFTLSSTTCQSFDEFLETQGLSDALTKYVIPVQDVARFRDQLDLVGIDERRLFPDLDGVAGAIQRYYG